MKRNPKLLLISDGSSSSKLIAGLLRDDFDVEALPPEAIGCACVKNASFFVANAPLNELNPDAARQLQAGITEDNSVLLVMHKALAGVCGHMRDFIGAGFGEKLRIPKLKLHVSPHYLTRGIPEMAEIDNAERGILTFTDSFSAISDNAFIEDSDSGIAAFERVYGLKGRVVVLAAGQCDGLSSVESRILGNLRLIKHTAENIDDNFTPDISHALAFHEDGIMEKHGDICRWNTLFCEENSDSTYTHSAVFLPGSPEFCGKNISAWAGGSDPGYDRERLWQSLTAVEIRNTDFCQQDCYYCYNRRDMDIKYVRTSLEEELHAALEEDLLSMRTDGSLNFFVRYTGTGEPLTHPRTIQSLLAFESEGIPTALITNGEALDAVSAKRLGEICSFVRFSVDASAGHTYSAIRNCPADVFDRVCENISFVANGGKCFAGVTFLVCRENWKEIYSFCVLMKSLGVRAVWIRSTDGCDPFSDREMAQIDSDIRKAIQLTDDRFVVTANQFHIYRKLSLLHYKYDNIRCWAAHTKAFVQPGGDVIICLSRPDYIIGNLHEQRFRDIWGGEAHLRFLYETGIKNCSQCIESRYNSAVDFLARNHTETIFKGSRGLEAGK